MGRCSCDGLGPSSITSVKCLMETKLGQVFGAAVRTSLGVLHLGWVCHGSIRALFWIPALRTWGGAGDGLSAGSLPSPCKARMEFWTQLQPGLTQAITGIWGVTQQVEDARSCLCQMN